MLKILRKNKIYLIAVLAVIVIAVGIHNAKEPEQCALCGGLKRHAPCIVNLAEGKVGELMIYEPHHTKVGEIAEEQPGGIFAFFPCAGFRAMRNSSAETSWVELPESYKRMNPKYFCRSCRERLHGMRGYALADLYDLDHIQVFPVSNGAQYEIRNYSVCIAANKQEISVEVQGKKVESSAE